MDRDKMSVHAYGSIELDPAKVLDDLEESQSYLASRLDELLRDKVIGKLDSDRAVLGIPAVRTFARTFNMPSSQEAIIEQAVNLEAEQYIPMPLDNLYVDYQVIKRNKKDLTVLMCAVPKKFIDTLLSAVRSAGLEVSIIEPSINAVARLLEATKEGGMPTVIIDIGPTSADIAVYDKAVRLTGGLNVGGNTFTLDIAKKMNIPLENAHQLKVLSGLSPGPRQDKITASLKPSLTRIANETRKVIRFYTDRSPNEARLEQVLIVGSGSAVPGLGEFFTNELIMPARVASPWLSVDFNKITQPAKQLRPRLITAVGLALVDPKVDD